MTAPDWGHQDTRITTDIYSVELMTYGDRARTARRIIQMTIKEIAEAVGKGESSVRRWVVKASATMADLSTKVADAQKSNVAAEFDLEETIAIIKSGLGVNASEMFRQNAASAPVSYQPHTDIDKLVALVETLVKTVTSMSYQQESHVIPSGNQLRIEAPKKTTRAELNQLVRKYATNVLAGDFSAAWRNLYSEILYRLSRNITLCAKNSRMSPIEYLEQENLLEPSCLIVVELLGEGNV